MISSLKLLGTFIALVKAEELKAQFFFDTIETASQPANEFHSGKILKNMLGASPNANKQVQSNKFVYQESARLSQREDIQKLDRAESEIEHEVVFAVKQLNLHKIESILNDISDPHSSNYGKHLTRHEISAITANPESSAEIRDYLESNGITVTNTTPNDEYITAVGTIGQFESLFNTEFFEYSYTTQERTKGQKLIRASQYSLPQRLTTHVTTVFNTVQFPPVFQSTKIFMPLSDEIQNQLNSHKNKKHTLADMLINGAVTPARLNQIYNISSNIANNMSSQAVYENLGETFSPTDLALFQSRFGLPDDPVDRVIGGHVDNDACITAPGCVEANLDVQYIMAVSQFANTTYYYWDENLDWMLAWLKDVAVRPDPPKVISISYGSYETQYSPAYMNQFNIEAMKLGVMGITIVVASGDDGAPGNQARYNPRKCGYFPSFPATSPYVTAVGGTKGPESGTTEKACQGNKGGVITTGGGFSLLSERPSWQNAHVEGYFANVSGTVHDPVLGYRRSGRGYPDVSVVAANYLVMLNKNLGGVYGTSASAPVFAGMVALVNAKRFAAGKSSLGWINPSLYALSSEFINDITDGDNKCVAHGSVCCSHGFDCTTGWDPVTGLGSVNYGKFEAAFMSLGNSPNSPTLAPTPAAGEPTEAPVLPPTLAPTVRPTTSPTSSKGWLYQTIYPKPNCTGPVHAVMGLATGTCFAQYNDAGTAIVAFLRVECRSDHARINRYIASNCAEEYLGAYQIIYYGCASSVNSKPYPSTYSSSMYCSNTQSLPLPTAESKGAFITQKHFASHFSCAGTPSSFASFRQDTCIPEFYNGAYYSYYFSNPTQTVYSGGTCSTANPTVTALSPNCQVGSVDDLLTGDPPESGSYYDDEFLDGIRKVSMWYWDSNVPTATPTQTPSQFPTIRPTKVPTVTPTELPTATPTVSSAPSLVPTTAPSTLPSIIPTTMPSVDPTVAPTTPPTLSPSEIPTVAPSSVPSEAPSMVPSTVTPSLSPTEAPSVVPSFIPSVMPSETLTHVPTTSPTVTPTVTPSQAPTAEPSAYPSLMPSVAPTATYTDSPTMVPSIQATEGPTQTSVPTAVPTSAPTDKPTEVPSAVPSIASTPVPTIVTVLTAAPTLHVIEVQTSPPTVYPTAIPSTAPSTVPTVAPTETPSGSPSLVPSTVPSAAPTNTAVAPSMGPTMPASTEPSVAPTDVPSQWPTSTSSVIPTIALSNAPTALYSLFPSFVPSTVPLVAPSAIPSIVPSLAPTESSTSSPSAVPSLSPSVEPSLAPSSCPSVSQSITPTQLAGSLASATPSVAPTATPTVTPSNTPVSLSTAAPTQEETPTLVPSVAPSVQQSTQSPSMAPSEAPLSSSEPPSETPSTVPTGAPSLALPTALPQTALPTVRPSRTPSASPTLKPTNSPVTASPTIPGATLTPTASPTKAQIYQFAVSQTLAGITLETYKIDLEANNLAFCFTVTITINLDVSACVVTNVTSPATTTRLLRRQLNIGNNGVNIDYEIQYNPIELGLTNAANAYNALTEKLEKSVQNGNFTNTLQTYAMDSGITALSNVTSASVTANGFTEVPSNDDMPPVTKNSSDKNMSDSMLIGLVVGLGGGGMLIVVVVVLYCCSNKGDSTCPALTTSTTHTEKLQSPGDHQQLQQQQKQQQQQQQQQPAVECVELSAQGKAVAVREPVNSASEVAI